MFYSTDGTIAKEMRFNFGSPYGDIFKINVNEITAAKKITITGTGSTPRLTLENGTIDAGSTYSLRSQDSGYFGIFRESSEILSISNYGDVFINAQDNGGITIVSDTDELSMIEFSDDVSGGIQNFIQCDHDGDILGYNAWGSHQFTVGEGVPSLYLSNTSTTVKENLIVDGNATFAGNVALTGSGAKIISAISSDNDSSLFLSAAGSGKDTHIVFGNNRALFLSKSSSATAESEGTPVLTLDANSNATFAGNVLITGTSDKGLRIKSGASALSYIDFSDADTGTPSGSIAYNNIVDAMTFATGGSNTERMRIDSSGFIKFNKTASTATAVASINHASNNFLYINGGSGGASFGDDSQSTRMIAFDSDFLRFDTSSLERMRITSDGLIKLPTTGINDTRHIVFTGTQGDTNPDNAGSLGMWGNEVRLAANWYYNGAHRKTVAGNGSGVIGIGAGDTDEECYLTFGVSNPSVSGGPIARMRITSAGYLKASNTGSYINSAGSYHEIRSNKNDSYIAILDNTTTSNSGFAGLNIRYSGISPDATSNSFLVCEDSTTVRMRVYSDGDVWTSDAGTLTSDETLKNNITDVTSKLDDVMNLRVRNYYWNEDYHPEKTGKKLIGFVAQEFEQVFPNLVSNHIIKKEEVDEDGIVTEEAIYKKGIKEGKLIPILVKSMQEQQEIINDLKARIETLENN
jgi:hypothetical protein